MAESRQSRRQFLRRAAGSAAALALGPGALAFGAPAGGPKPSDRPNVLFLFSDQHRACSLPGEPHCNVIAPNMQRMWTAGARMDRCISNYPVCSPYRATLMTSRWPMQTGMVDNNLPLGENEYCLAEAFRDAGYHTGYVGKWHLGSGANGDPFGFDFYRPWAGTNNHWQSAALVDGKLVQRPGYNATGMTDDALEFIRQDHGGKPWLLMVSWNPPHSNMFDAPKEFQALYDPQTIPAPPNVETRPGKAKGEGGAGSFGRLMQGYQSHITAIDKELGRLLEKLDEPALKNTLVTYSADHGEAGFAHGMTGKRLPYDESCRVPFLARWPGKIAPGTRSNALFQSIDIYPTLCALAGIQIPPSCIGRDLSAAFLGKPFERSESAFLMHMATGRPAQEGYIFRGVRTEEFTYAEKEDGPWLLYDDREDPFQTKNLVEDPAHKAVLEKMRQTLRKYLDQTGDKWPQPPAINRPAGRRRLPREE